MKKSKPNSEAPILTSPEGVKIQITAGRKLQEIRSYAEDPEITDAQFRALVCVVDRLNEGRSGDESRWGSAYPNYETLAKDIAKDARAAKRIIKELKTGQREIRSKSGERKLVPCKAVLNVKSTKKGKSDEVNEYRLKKWGAFAVASGEDAFTAPPQSEEGEVTGQEGCGDPSGGMRSPVHESPVTAPDSSQGPRSETHPKDPPQSAPASGERGPANLDSSQVGDGASPQAGNENQRQDEDTRPYREAAERCWGMFQKAPQEERPEFIRQFVALCHSGKIKGSRSFEFGIRQMQASRSEICFHTRPLEFLERRMWLDYNSGDKAKSAMAI
ncbi:hypothetical protein [Bradyrhizobium sp. WSM2254]|uniref:hypothetical protein n=1 Tax=Bradyrhizobium sp. WSM2254 TaxID=1188263 RepID=UPI0012EC2E53|nr:hypothetical protein [Bradyrhizobium sp. WSM2254]